MFFLYGREILSAHVIITVHMIYVLLNVTFGTFLCVFLSTVGLKPFLFLLKYSRMNYKWVGNTWKFISSFFKPAPTRPICILEFLFYKEIIWIIYMYTRSCTIIHMSSFIFSILELRSCINGELATFVVFLH